MTIRFGYAGGLCEAISECSAPLYRVDQHYREQRFRGSLQRKGFASASRRCSGGSTERHWQGGNSGVALFPDQREELVALPGMSGL
jgi:hypothetical protein